MINFDYSGAGVEIYPAFPTFNEIIFPIQIPQQLVLDNHSYRKGPSKRPNFGIGPTAFQADTKPFAPVADPCFTVPMGIDVQLCDQPLAPFGFSDTVWCAAYKPKDQNSTLSPTMLFLLDLCEYASDGSGPGSQISDTVIFFLNEFPEYLPHFGLAPPPRTTPLPARNLTDVACGKGKALATHLPRLESSVIYTKSKRD